MARIRLLEHGVHMADVVVHPSHEDEEEYGEECVIVATGRYSSLVTPLCKRKIICDKELILKGLIEVYYKNC